MKTVRTIIFLAIPIWVPCIGFLIAPFVAPVKAQEFSIQYQNPPMTWSAPQDGEHWLILAWYPPANCSTGSYAVWCEPAGARIYTHWEKSEADAIKFANDTQAKVLGIYFVKETKLKKVEHEKRIPQPDEVKKTIEYKAEASQ